MGIVGKARTAIIFFFQIVALDHGAHGAVQDQDAMFEQRFEQGQALSAGR